METPRVELPPNGHKKELFNRLKTTMTKEAQEVPSVGTRRGFLHALVSGGVVAMGMGTLAVIGSSPVAVAGLCGKTISCGGNESLVCDAYGVTCPTDFSCTGGFTSCSGCQTAYETCPETIHCIGCLDPCEACLAITR